MTRAIASSVVLHGILFVLGALLFTLPAVRPRLKLNYVDLWPPKGESPGPDVATPPRRAPAVLPSTSVPGAENDASAATPKADAAPGEPLGAGVTVPFSQVLSLGNPAPQYPASSLQKGHEGTVVLKLRQQANGRVGEIELVSSSGYSALDRAAIEAAARWKLGDELPKSVSVPIRFRIEE